LDDADSPLHALVHYWTREAFMAGRWAKVTRFGWQFPKPLFDVDESNDDHAYAAWLAQRTQKAKP
jgi:hypothetical protein